MYLLTVAILHPVMIGITAISSLMNLTVCTLVAELNNLKLINGNKDN